jgi:hypothetical protein
VRAEVMHPYPCELNHAGQCKHLHERFRRPGQKMEFVVHLGNFPAPAIPAGTGRTSPRRPLPAS